MITSFEIRDGEPKERRSGAKTNGLIDEFRDPSTSAAPLNRTAEY